MYEIFALSSITKMCKTINNWFDLQYTIVWIIYYMELKFASWFSFWNFVNNFYLGLVSMHMWLVHYHDPIIMKQFCECTCLNFYTHMKTKKKHNRDWSTKFATGLIMIVKINFYSIFWQVRLQIDNVSSF